MVEEDAKKQIRARLVSKKMQMKENFANAREVRNMFEDIITNQARRVAAMENPTHDDMMLITIMDLSDDIGDHTDTKEMEKMEEAAKDVRVSELKLPGEEIEEAEGAEELPDADADKAPEKAEDAEPGDNTEQSAENTEE